MAFGFGFALTAIAKAVGFTPRSLFTSGAQGAWYDPSDYSTMFEDAAGTIPITSPLEKPVGLMLDKSKGLVLGSEIVINGSFDSGTGWTLSNAAATISGGTLNFSAAAATTYARYYISDGGKYLQVVIVINSVTAGAVGIQFDASVGSTIQITTPGTYTYRIKATSGNSYFYVVTYGASTTAVVDSVSVKEVTGNHATQSTTTSRPTLSARYNLLTKTEQFDDAAWVKNVPLSVVSKTEIAPDGTASATRVTSATAANIYQVIQNSVGQTFKVWVKSATATNQTFLMFGNRNQYFTKTATTSWQLFECSPSLIGSDGWWGLQLGSSVPNDLLIWHPDIRPANDGIGLPAYQRVNTATDYDYAGFPPYLKFDGVDDGMATGSIDFSGTDKMSVFAGVRKLSDAAIGVLIELSANSGSPDPSINPGSFYFAAPATIGASGDYQFAGHGGSIGAQLNQAATSTALPAPRSNVLTATGNIFGDLNAIRINGSASGTNGTGDQGTGNYGNYPLYIGRRGGTTLPFNGRLYSLVVCGKTASASEITSTENWIEVKTFGKDMNYVYSDEVLTAASEQITTADGQNVYMTVTYQ